MDTRNITRILACCAALHAPPQHPAAAAQAAPDPARDVATATRAAPGATQATQAVTTATQDTVGVRRGAIGVHLLGGGQVARLDVHGGATNMLGGARLGLGLGELVKVLGWYNTAFDREGTGPEVDAEWGAELQLNLNTGAGVAPFVTAGLARVELVDQRSQDAAVAGAGVLLPLGPVLLHGGVRNYIFGVTGLRNAGSPEDLTHNWQFSAGVLLALGRGRPQVPVVVARSPAAQELAALRDSLARVSAERDALALRALTRDTLPGPDTLAAGVLASLVQRDTTAARNYHSSERIEIPIPTWGSITLRYGPEPGQPAPPPIIVHAGGVGVPVPVGQAAAGGVAAAAEAPAAAQQAPPAQPPAQPPVQQPPPQVVQPPQTIVLPPAQQPQTTFVVPPGQVPQGGFTQSQMDLLAQRVLDGVRLTLLPQLDAAQAQRDNALRRELREELARIESALGAPAGRAPAAAAPPPQVAPGLPAVAPQPAPPAAAAPTPPALPTAPRPEGVPVPDPAVVVAEADVRRARAEVDQAEAARALREAAAGVAGREPSLLWVADTPRGLAVVLRDDAFTPDGLNIDGRGRDALGQVAELLREYPDRTVIVQAHVDGGRSELESQRLTELRAEAVRALLVQRGIAPDRVLAVGYGHARPVASDANVAGRMLNRRVEIVIGGE